MGGVKPGVEINLGYPTNIIIDELSTTKWGFAGRLAAFHNFALVWSTE